MAYYTRYAFQSPIRGAIGCIRGLAERAPHHALFQSPIRGAIGCISPRCRAGRRARDGFQSPIRGAIGCIGGQGGGQGGGRGGRFQSPIRGAIGCIWPTARRCAATPRPLSVPYPRGNWLHRVFRRAQGVGRVRPFQSPIRGAIGCIRGHQRAQTRTPNPFSPLSAGQLAASHQSDADPGVGHGHFQSPIRGAIGCIAGTRRPACAPRPPLSVPYPRGNWLHLPPIGPAGPRARTFSPLSAGQLAASLDVQLGPGAPPGFQSPIRGAIGCIHHQRGVQSRSPVEGFQSPIRGAIGCIPAAAAERGESGNHTLGEQARSRPV
jgi:hypothetical protein